MFVLTANVTLGGFKPIKPHSLKWKRSIDDYSDTAVITVPAITMLKTTGDQYKKVDTGLQLVEGMKVMIEAGYNGNNVKRFEGFIRRRNFSVPLEIECEGYSYQLRKKVGYNKSYATNTKLKVLLNDLIQGTDIKLSALIPDITIESPVWFKNVSRIQVLDWLKDNMLLSAYFNYNELFVGLREQELKGEVKLRLGWNTIKDNALKFNSEREYADVRIQLGKRNKDGSMNMTDDSAVNTTGVKIFKIGVRLSAYWNEQIRASLKKHLLNVGYEGTITTFLIPFAEPGMKATIDDPRYQERKGSYFIESVDGELSPSGGRQKIKIGNVL